MSNKDIRAVAHDIELRAEDMFGPLKSFPVLDFIETFATFQNGEQLDFLVTDDAELDRNLAVYLHENRQIVVSRLIYEAARSPEHPLHNEAIYTLAHELGHWALCHGDVCTGQSVEGLEVSALPGEDSELQADCFAAEILMSTTRLASLQASNEEFADQWQVTPQRAKERIRALKREKLLQ